MAFLSLDFLTEIMPHTGQVGRLTTNAHHQTTATSVTTTACFAFQGGFLREEESGLQRTETFDWDVVLPSSVKPYVDVGDALLNVVDDEGTVMISNGIIRVITDYSHWSEGRQVLIAGVERG